MSHDSEKDLFFDVSHLTSNLKSRAVRGGLVTMGGQFGCKFVQICSTMVLARILGPKEFGVFAMIIAVVGFIELFKDLGLTMATVQRETISHQQVSNLFWINVAAGTVLCLVMMLLAPVLAWFYGEPRLLLLTIVLSLGMVFSGMSAQHTAILRRKMRYRAIATIYFTAVILSSTVGIIMAKFGAGIWSLVAMALIGSVYGVIASWSVCRWIPSLPRRGAGTRELMAFGGNLTTCNFLNYLTRNMDNILIGKFVGPLALGFYNKAYEILMLPVRQINRPVTNVAVTTLSRLQDNPEQYRSYYRKGQLLTMVIGLPVVVFFFVKADPLVTVVLGQDWAGAIPLFRLLAPAALMGVFNGATGWVYISTGQMRRQLRMEIVVSTIQVTGFAIGLRWGAMGVAASFSIVSVLTFVPSLWYCYRTSVLNLSDFFDTLWRPLAASFIAGSGIYFVNEFFPNIYSNFAVTNLIIDLGFLALLYLLVWQILPGGRKIMGDLSGIFMSAVSRPRVSKAPAS